ncbi:MAG: helix-turn-helix domain-containing protein [Alphaproteobacteria bacterium]
MDKTNQSSDWSSKRISYELEQRANCTLSDIDRDRGLPRATCANATYRPNLRGEIAISKTLKIAAHIIWPSRYDTTGKRLKPQPKSNYGAIDSRENIKPQKSLTLQVKHITKNKHKNKHSKNNTRRGLQPSQRQKAVRG